MKAEPDPPGSGNAARTMVSIVKEDLRRRFENGLRPSVKEYIDQYPDLAESRDGMMSLLYEEYCLREEMGETLDPERFCEQYEPWRDSLISQLQYHAAFSRLASVHRPRANFPEPGDSFLWFDLDSKLGEGGAGRVYLARDRNLGGRRVALKISLDKGNEPSIQGRLNHPNIVPVHQVEREPESGLRGLCMPYNPGLSLDCVIERVFQISPEKRQAELLWDVLADLDSDPEEEPVLSKNPGWIGFPAKASYERGVAWLVMKLAEALVHAHGRDVLHRDIKPANVLLTRRNGPMLLDFNLSQARDTPEEVENAACGGTLPYMAPEQLRAFLDPDLWSSLCPATDIYSLGLVLRELLTGVRPTPTKRGIPVARMVNEQLDIRRDDSLITARNYNRRISPGLDSIIKKCLAFKEVDRYKKAQDLAQDLERYVARRPLRHAENPSSRERVTDLSIRLAKPALLTGAIVGLALLSSTAAYDSYTANAPNAESLTNQAIVTIDDVTKTKEERFGKAETFLAQALIENPQFVRALQTKGLLAYKQNQLETSLQFFDRAIKAAAEQKNLDPGTISMLFFDRSSALSQLGSENAVQAVNRHDESEDLDSQSRALIEKSKTRLTQALHDLEEAKVSLPEGKSLPLIYEFRVAKLLVLIGDLYSLEDDFSQSAKSFQQALGHLNQGMNQPNLEKIQLKAHQDLRDSINQRILRQMSIVHE